MSMIKGFIITRIILCAAALSLSTYSWGQSLDLQLANEYFAKGDLDKAYVFYTKVRKADPEMEGAYDNYIYTLGALEKWGEQEKFLKRSIKLDPTNYVYKVDFALNQRYQGNEDGYQKMIKDINDEVKKSNLSLPKAIDAYEKRRLLSEALDLYKDARYAQHAPARFAGEMATLYKFLGQKENMVDELLTLIQADPRQLETVQNTLQIEIASESDQDMLIKKLYSKVQSAQGTTFNQMLVWLYVQRKDFRNAFIQEKSIDRREGLRGTRLLDLGEIAMKNQDYKAAVDIFQCVTERYPDDYNYVISQRHLIEAKEALAKVTYPVDTNQIKSLVGDYEELLTRTNRVNDLVEIKRSIALLYAFYLHDISESIAILTEAIQTPRTQPFTLAQCKLDLGDIYILAEEPWESTLLYSQVEKALKDNRLAHLAKLKNAKLSYFKGEFEFAQAHLDVLKLATTREIANDAMDLGLLIKDNLALDTSKAALMHYASVELLIYQKKYDEALASLDDLLKMYPNHSLTDEVYFQKGKINLTIGRYERAEVFLKKMVDDFEYDILTDDATFMLAEIYDYHLKDSQQAMSRYKQILIQYPGSIYAAEARKRFRSLRGDKIN